MNHELLDLNNLNKSFILKNVKVSKARRKVLVCILFKVIFFPPLFILLYTNMHVLNGKDFLVHNNMQDMIFLFKNLNF